MNLDKANSVMTTLITGDSGAVGDEAILLRCESAQKLEDEGNYEEASLVLGDLWQGIGQRPRLDGLLEATQAEVLLHAAAISGGIGRLQQIEGSQEAAKD